MMDWKDANKYKTPNDGEVIIIRAREEDPVKWYTEYHQHGEYVFSHGSRMPTKLLAVAETFLQRAKLSK